MNHPLMDLFNRANPLLSQFLVQNAGSYGDDVLPVLTSILKNCSTYKSDEIAI